VPVVERKLLRGQGIEDREGTEGKRKGGREREGGCVPPLM